MKSSEKFVRVERNGKSRWVNVQHRFWLRMLVWLFAVFSIVFLCLLVWIAGVTHGRIERDCLYVATYDPVSPEYCLVLGFDFVA